MTDIRGVAAPAVDIVIPCYNESAAAIERTIRSIRGQSRAPRRVLLVDDCSADQSGLADATALGAEVLRLPRNGGISAARNAGIRKVNGVISTLAKIGGFATLKSIRQFGEIATSNSDHKCTAH